jgi:hypothetical protein
MSQKHRVMWLLNHTTLRPFEIDQLKNLGFTEFFLPKSYPYDEGNLSASVDYSEDANLSIPKADLKILNAQNWYDSPSQEAWDIANKHFDLVFCAFFIDQLESVIEHFKGVVVLRVFGLSQDFTYSEILTQQKGTYLLDKIKTLRDRFFFGAGYDHLGEIEDRVFSSRHCFLPVGLSKLELKNTWTGGNKKIMFVCPRIATSGYYHSIYKKFCHDFEDFDYLIGGAQPLKVNDPKVIGFVSKEQHEDNMRLCDVMYYHSQEVNHIHYHPFEAIKVGMPLIFMAGSMLDLMGGLDQPGRCTSISEAQAKIKKIMGGDRKLIEKIRTRQVALLEPMKPEVCGQAWQKSFEPVLASLANLDTHAAEVSALPQSKPRIAVIVPVGYKGGSLRAAKMTAEAIYYGAQQDGHPVEVVLAHLDEPDFYTDEDFEDMDVHIKRRSYTWQKLDYQKARVAMYYAGAGNWRPSHDGYLAMNDGANHMMDCDLWVFISDRVPEPILALRPYAVIVYDYLQRYQPILTHGADQPYLDFARKACATIVTSAFTEQDALNYAGIERKKLFYAPTIAPDFSSEDTAPVSDDAVSEKPYFLWTTNAAPHKNHLNALKGIIEYYEFHNGQLDCHVSGVDTDKIFKGKIGNLEEFYALYKSYKKLKKKMTIKGYLTERMYKKSLRQAQFVFHPTLIDNGTFAVFEAAQMAVPSLTNSYPAMQEYDARFKLNLTYMNARKPQDIASMLKEMELEAPKISKKLKQNNAMKAFYPRAVGPQYWEIIKQCL